MNFQLYGTTIMSGTTFSHKTSQIYSKLLKKLITISKELNQKCKWPTFPFNTNPKIIHPKWDVTNSRETLTFKLFFRIFPSKRYYSKQFTLPWRVKVEDHPQHLVNKPISLQPRIDSLRTSPLICKLLLVFLPRSIGRTVSWPLIFDSLARQEVIVGPH